MSDKTVDIFKNTHKSLNEAKEEITKVIIGQDDTVDQTLVTLISGGHVLLVGVPGLAKTLLVETVAKVFGLDSSRVQCTPDLMPADIIGSEILEEDAKGKRSFRFIEGPIFTQLFMADEINRASPRTQSALLQAMQEKEISIAGKTRELPEPFHVLATQNPIEQEGTYPLPEAQLDRFMFAINLDYPSFQEEVDVVKATTSDHKPTVNSLFSDQEIINFQQLIRRIPVADNVIEYAVQLVSKTRPKTESAAQIVNDYIDWGAGPRASQNLILGAKTHAAVNGKYSPDIEDVQAVATGILRHRLIKNYKAEAEGLSIEDIIKSLF